MKYLLTIFFFFCLNSSFAVSIVYYVSASGNDANNGTSAGTAWQTIAKVNATTFAAGDNILFNRGDVFYGSLTIAQSGAAGNPITFGAYGTGAKPVITGFILISSWTNLGSNIWQSTSAVSSRPYTNMVTVNGVNTAMGRIPNSGFYTYQTHSGTTSITSSDLTGTPNWTNAELAMFVNTYTLGRNPITAQSGGTLTYTATSLDPGIQSDVQRFIIQNDVRTLDVQDEWYYDASVGKLKIYSTATPADVQLTTIDTLVKLSGKNYITFDNIEFKGSNIAAVDFINSKQIWFTNCDFNFHGQQAIHNDYGGASTGLTVSNCTFNQVNGSSINVSGDADAVTVTNSTFNNVGMIFGAGEKNGVGYSGIRTTGANSLFRRNSLSNIGYVGIEFRGNNSIVDSNFVTNYCATLTDGGGVYTYNGSNATFTGRKVSNNVLTASPGGVGVYMDDLANGVEIYNNSVSGNEVGIYLHGANNINAHGNNLYNNTNSQIRLQDETGEAFNNITLKNNSVTSLSSTQEGVVAVVATNYLSTLGTLDSNYYSRFTDNQPFLVQIGSPYSYNNYTLASWKTLSSQDANSKGLPKTVTDINDLRFEYNEIASSKTVDLEAYIWMDLQGVDRSGSLTLAPYSSKVLIKNGAYTALPVNIIQFWIRKNKTKFINE